MKTMFFGVCVAVALLMIGCGRSRPASEKAAVAEAAVQEDAPPPPPDKLPPHAAATPVAAAPAQASPGVSFAPIPPSRDPAAQAEMQKYRDIRARQAEGTQREKEEARAAAMRNALQGSPENNAGQ
ncbi:MAG: hypothetical protein QM741_03395 [Rudaea sp.]|uniref:hypothetical protein n=1 Tax=Rudaea sp. TaxID=2136325 RepID=UPI0039E6FD2B